MTLGQKLAIIFAAFLAILVAVIWLAFRERRLGKQISPTDIASQQSSDARVMITLFSSIIGGMLLTVIVAYLVFF